MSLFMVTGQAGSGKSTVCNELKQRGINALDTDDDALARWVNKSTGYVHPKSSVPAADRTPQFLAEHDFMVPRSVYEALGMDATQELTIICGVAGNWPDVKDLFIGGVLLQVDEETTKYRLFNRTNNNWGKDPHELELTLNWKRHEREEYGAYGFTFIDSSLPAGEVADAVVAAATA